MLSGFYNTYGLLSKLFVKLDFYFRKLSKIRCTGVPVSKNLKILSTNSVRKHTSVTRSSTYSTDNEASDKVKISHKQT